MSGETENKISFRRFRWRILISDRQICLAEYFFRAVAVIFFLTALAKLIAAKGNDPIYNSPDPILFLKNRLIMILFAIFEFFLSAMLILNRNERLKAILIAWIGTSLLVYHAGLRWMDSASICDCLGNLKDYLPLSPRTLDQISFLFIGFMLIGSYFFLIRDFLANCKAEKESKHQTTPVQVEP